MWRLFQSASAAGESLASRQACMESVPMMSASHALPEGWWSMSYPDFLAARRPLIAAVIRAGYGKLAGLGG